MAKATVKERIFADIILKALGAKKYGGAYNPYLEAAIIAWVRQEGGAKNANNNWLGIMSGGKFVKYATYQAAAKATAERLLKYPGYYSGIVKAVRLGIAAGQTKAHFEADEQEQARRFLLELGKSPWSGTQYGYKPGADVTTLTVYAQYYKLLQAGSLPAIPPSEQKKKPPNKPKKPVQPAAPKYLQPPPLNHVWPDPYEARRFLQARRPDTMVP